MKWAPPAVPCPGLRGCGRLSLWPFPLVFKAETSLSPLADSLGPGLEPGGGLGTEPMWVWWALPAPSPWQACLLPTSPAHPLCMFFFKSALSLLNLNLLKVIVSGPGSQPHSPQIEGNENKMRLLDSNWHRTGLLTACTQCYRTH